MESATVATGEIQGRERGDLHRQFLRQAPSPRHPPLTVPSQVPWERSGVRRRSLHFMTSWTPFIPREGLLEGQPPQSPCGPRKGQPLGTCRSAQDHLVLHSLLRPHEGSPQPVLHPAAQGCVCKVSCCPPLLTADPVDPISLRVKAKVPPIGPRLIPPLLLQRTRTLEKRLSQA